MVVRFNPNLNLQDFQDGKGLKKGAVKMQNLDIAAALQKFGEADKPEVVKARKKLGKANKSEAAKGHEKLDKLKETESAKARKKLNNIKASNGMTYKEAKAKIKEIEQKYMSMSKDDGCGGLFSNIRNKNLKIVHDPAPKGPHGTTLAVNCFHYEVDGNSIPEPDKTEYRKAQAAIAEIEHNNSALVSDARADFGLEFKS